MSTTLEIQPRNLQQKAKVLRREGVLPATMYGPEIEATSIQMNMKDFKKISFADYKRLIELKTDDDTHEVLIKNIQKNYLTQEPMHVEFYKVKKGHMLTTEVALKFVGNSEAIKLGCDLVVQHDYVNIKCLPRDIPYNIEVDLSSLNKPGDMIAIHDLKFDSDKIEVTTPPKEIVCKAQAKRGGAALLAAEEEIAPAEGAAATPEAAPAA
jgi:large subunit ribosomal protein L25